MSEYKPDKLDKALMAGAGFDWITPLWSLLGGARGKVEHFVVPLATIYTVNAALDDAGIRRHNEQFEGDWYLFDVGKEDAKRASALLGLG